ncbi:hypothetical protein [Nocardia sp. NPDC060259]|uniref:hypothetical protein n=1 Tax=Nocardia sp. NPDC060259 TaxID=3347088 RepID=UPI003650E78A
MSLEACPVSAPQGNYEVYIGRNRPKVSSLKESNIYVSPPDNRDHPFTDPELTEVIRMPVNSDDSDDADDLNDEQLLDNEPDTEVVPDEEPASPLARQWRRFASYAKSASARRHLPYAAVAAAVVCAGIGVLVATGTNTESTDAVTDAAASSEEVPGTQSFDDITALLPGGYDETATVETTEPSTFSEIPSDLPLPEGGLGTDGATEDPLASEPVTVTETAPIDPVGSDDPVVTETVTDTATETSEPTTVTETPAGSQWPNVSLNGSVTMPERGGGGSQHPDVAPSTVTVTVEAPAETTTAPTTKTTTPKPKPSSCRTATPSKTKPKSTTTPKTTTTRVPSTTRTQRPTTPKKSATTTTARPCK